ncbi:MAG: cadherin repeat domain-containing protein, partial [Planctomycetota bacterium]
PNVTSPEGEGFANYKVRAKTDLVSGDRIDAQADIVFDLNDPILTAPIFNTIDDGAPTSTVDALPAVTNDVDFTVSWTGADDEGGSGIATFDAFVSTNNGPFEPFLLGTSETSAVFNGVAGDRYAFRAVATDLVGFVEDDPGVEEAFTFVDVNDAPTIGLLDRNIPSTEILARSDTFLRPLTLGNDPAGDFLDIGNRTPENNDLFDTVLQLPLAAAGSDVKRIVVQLSTEEVAAGDRLAFGVTDGEHIVAARRLDETVDGGLVQFFQIDNDLIDQTLGRNIATDTGYVETIELELLLRPTETEMIIRFGDTVDSFIGPETLDPNADLNLILVGQRASDAYRIRQLDAIVDGENGTFEIDENLADGTIAVSDLVANDPDTDETFQWSIVSGNDEGAFEIDTNTGVITVSDGTQLDFETVMTPVFVSISNAPSSF